MASIFKIGIVLWSLVLCLSLANAGQSAGRMEVDPCADFKGGQADLTLCSQEEQQGIKTMKGRVLKVDGDTLFIERFNGQEVEFRLTPALKRDSVFKEGDRIEAKTNEVNSEEHLMSIHKIE